MSTNNINLAGEFYAMHALFRHGYVPALTLGNTKGVDILLYNPINEKQFQVEVKASSVQKSEQHFGGKNITWQMNKKHEEMISDNLVFCFVYIPSAISEHPKLFFVPSAEVARYVRWEHDHWLHTVPHKRAVKSSDKRTYRISVSHLNELENNYAIFD